MFNKKKIKDIIQWNRSQSEKQVVFVCWLSYSWWHPSASTWCPGITSLCSCNCYLAEMAHYWEIITRAMRLRCFNLENEAIPIPIGKGILEALFGSLYFFNHLNSRYNKDYYEILIKIIQFCLNHHLYKHHHHQGMLTAWISLTPSRHLSLSATALCKSSRQYPVSAQNRLM